MDWYGGEMLLLGADMDEFRLEKNVKPDKSLDEIEKLYVDENLSQLDRVCLLLGSTFDVQKIWAIEQIIPVLKLQGSDVLVQKVLPKFFDTLRCSSVDVHTSASQCFAQIARENSLQNVTFVSHLLPTILSEFENRSASISNVWLEALLAAIPVIPKDILKHRVLNLARSRCQLSQPIQARQSSCAIIGKIAGRMENYWVKQELLPLVRTLSQDVDHEVRISMCKELPGIAGSLGSDFAKKYILPEVEELSKDDEVEVRCVAMVTVAEMIPLVDDDSRKEMIVPLVIRSLEEAVGRREGGKSGGGVKGDDERCKLIQFRLQASEMIGQFCHGLRDFYSKEDIKLLLEIYSDLSNTHYVSTPTRPIPILTEAQSTPEETNILVPSIMVCPAFAGDEGAECRRMCAYNVPAMMLFADSFKLTEKLIPVLKTLVSDPYWNVRRTIAHGFHEVVKLFGKRSQCLIHEYNKLLKDSNPEVLMGVINNLQPVLETFVKAYNLDHKTKQPGLLDIIQPLIIAEQMASKCRQWRIHSNLVENLVHLTCCMTSDQLYGKFVPLLWKCIGNNRPPNTGEGKSTVYVLPVKIAACKTMCNYIKSIRKVEQRKEICNRFITECAQSSNYKQRLLFIDVCHIILSLFSRQFFKENGFYSAVVSLAKDSTVNVRYRLCSLLPDLKSILLLPPDREYQQEFESAIATLLMERDPECLVAVRHSVKRMDKINYRIQSMVIHSFVEDEVLDKDREEFEKHLLKEEEEWEREKDREGSNSRLYPDPRKSAPSSRQSPGTTRASTGKKQNQPVNKAVTRTQQLSPGLQKKTSNLTIGGVYSAPNSPHAGTKTGTKKVRSTSIEGSTTPESIKKTLQTQTTNDVSPTETMSKSSTVTSTSGKRVCSTGSSPNLLLSTNKSSGSSTKGVQSTRSKESSIGAGNKSSPSQSSRKTQYGLAYSTKAVTKKTSNN